MRCLIIMFIVTHAASSLAGQGFAQEPIMLASEGGVSLYSVPLQAEFTEFRELTYRSTKIVAKSEDPTQSLSRFEDISINGDVVQIWNIGFGGIPEISANVFRPNVGLTYDPRWIPLDTHLLFPDETYADLMADFSFELSESNDISLGSTSGPIPCTFCIGSIGIGSAHLDGWFELLPEFASDEIELAQIVTTGSATISVGVPGDGFGALFKDIEVAFVPEPSFKLWPLLVLVVMQKRRPQHDGHDGVSGKPASTISAKDAFFPRGTGR